MFSIDAGFWLLILLWRPYMKTLIELYDENPIENLLGTEVFRPEEMVILASPEIVSERALKETYRKYFEHRGVPVKVIVEPVSLLDAGKVERRLRQIIAGHPDCAIDISGGTDASLFAAGAVGGDVPVYTYSRKRNTFYEIRNAPFAKNRPCDLRLDTRSCFLMAGGTLLKGRGDNAALKNRLDDIEKLFSVFRKHRRVWRNQIGYIQKVSSSLPGELLARGLITETVDKHRITADRDLLYDLYKNGLINELRIGDDEVRFAFPDETVRFWLRDIGAVLELEVYRACIEAGCFDDVVLSAIVNWQGKEEQRDSVTNEIDVVAVRGIQPVLISCKTSEIKTEALNELAILKDRFGGKYSRAIIVTSANPTASRSLMRMRAAEMGIEVVEWNDITGGRLTDVLAERR